MRQTSAASLTLKSAILFAFFYEATFAQENCCSIGNSNENATTAERGISFYLNIANPAPCTGNITSWRVCYYGPDQDLDSGDRFTYWATYAVYRKMGSGADERYEQVSQLFSAIRATNSLVQLDTSGIIDGVIQQQDINCYDDSITAPLTVQAGDVLGACVFNPEDERFFTRIQLDVVGRASGESLLRMGADGCSMTSLPTSVQTSQLSNVNSRRLHIYANIEPTNVTTTQTEATSTEATSIPTTVTRSNKLATTLKPEVTVSTSFFPQLEDQKSSRVSLIIMATASTSGAVIICITLSLVLVTSVIVCLKRRQKTLQLTSNIAYIGQCTKQDTDYYTVSQPPARNAVNLVDEHLITNDMTIYKSSQDQPSATLCNNTILDTAVDMEAQQPCEGSLSSVNLVQNDAYKPLTLALSSNVAYESHMYQDTENQDEYDYIKWNF